jgi:hypothetical protein
LDSQQQKCSRWLRGSCTCHQIKLSKLPRSCTSKGALPSASASTPTFFLRPPLLRPAFAPVAYVPARCHCLLFSTNPTTYSVLGTCTSCMLPRSGIRLSKLRTFLFPLAA